MTLGVFLTTLIIILILIGSPIIIILTKYKETKDKDKLKSTISIISIIDIILVLILLSVWVTPIKNKDIIIKKIEKQTKEVNEDVTLNNAGFNKVTVDEYLSLLGKDEKNIILIARPTCGYCVQFTPILKQAKDDLNLTIYYLDTDSLTSENEQKFYNSLDYLQGNWGTPLVMIIGNNKLINKNEGYTDLNTIKEFFISNGFGN